MILRIIFLIILLLSAMFAPWQITAGMATVLMAAFSRFWEAIPVGFLVGAIYGFPRGESGFLFAFFVSIFALAFIIEEYFKRLAQGRNIISYALIAFSGGILISLLWLVFKIVI
jgi:hypothetical protein